MSFEQIAVFVLLAALLALFAWNRLRYDIVALLGLLVAVALGLVSADDAFAGFGHPAVITVAAVLVLSKALGNAGVVDALASRLSPLATRPLFYLIALCFLAAFFSAFMNNIGALALLLPLALASSKTAGLSPSMVLMPMSFASILGGMTTLIGTPPNIIISQVRQERVGEAFNLFDFSPVGVCVALAGVLFVTLAGRKLLPQDRESQDSLEELFEIRDYVTEIKVEDAAEAVGKSITELESAWDGRLIILGIIREERRIGGWIRQERLLRGDILLIQADAQTLKTLVAEHDFSLVADPDLGKELRRGDLAIMEAVVPPNAWIEGKTPASLWLRSRHGINLLGIARQGRPFKARLRSVQLQAGDVLLIQGDERALPTTIAALGCLPLAQRKIDFEPRQSALPLGVFGLAILFSALGITTAAIAFVGAAVAMVLLGQIQLRDLYLAIDWPVIVLLGALIPVGGALETTGAGQVIADGLVSLGGGLGPLGVLAIMMVITMLLTDVMNNAATAVVMAPIGVTVAQTLGVSVDPFLIGVAIAASSAFLTPIGHQNNTLVMGPGGYRFTDYWRLGLPLDAVLLVVALIMIPLVWPF